MSKKALFMIWAKVRPEDEEAFNKWYNEEHMPRAIERLPGILCGRRYKILEGEDEYQFMAHYEFDSYEALQEALASDAFQGLVGEYNEAFGKGGRKRIKAVQLKALTVG